MRRVLLIAFALMLLLSPLACIAEATETTDMDYGRDDIVYKLFDEKGNYMTSRAGQIFVDDEYISGDDQLYRVASVDDVQCTAIANHIGQEPAISSSEAQQVMAVLDQKSAQTASPSASTGPDKASGNNLICMYSTHSDESYVKGDGTSSKNKGGIYDVGDTLKKNLEAQGITVEYSKDTFHPHDAGAYRRSRQVAEDFIKKQPAVLLDLHRDGIPDASEYTTTVDGEKMTKIRLFVGRNNPNSDANRALAKKIKADADKKYKGLIKDIFIGKGNYNQELYPKALLLELGTHTSNKDDVETSTKYIAEVINDVVFGSAAKAEAPGGQTQNKSGATGIAWIIGIAIVGAALYGLVATGTLGNWKAKLARGSSEITGGLIGRKPDDKDEP